MAKALAGGDAAGQGVLPGVRETLRRESASIARAFAPGETKAEKWPLNYTKLMAFRFEKIMIFALAKTLKTG